MKRRPWATGSASAPLTGAKKKVPPKTVADWQVARELQAIGPLKVMPDYCAELPLWGPDWESLHLDPALLDRLADWQDDFDANFVAGKGWKTPEARNRWSREAVRLEDQLRQALPDVEITVDLWPLG